MDVRLECGSIGAYTLRRRLGVGGMGEVWLARRRGLGEAEKTVALKVIAPSFEHELAGEQFATEARLSMLMSHPNVVQAFDAGRAGDCTYLAMEWIDGVSLAVLAEDLRGRGCRLAHGVIAYVVRCMLSALAHLHALPREDGRPLCVVHNDVSPHNVLVSRRGEVKLTDFGVAVVRGEHRGERIVGGKPRYMAPERFESSTTADPRADVFGVGAILHELLTGRRHDPRRKHKPLPNAPDVLRRLRDALLEPDVRKRPTAAAALAMLDQALAPHDAATALGTICSAVIDGTAPATQDPTTSTAEQTTIDRTCPTMTWSVASRRRRETITAFMLGMLSATAFFIGSVAAFTLLG